MKKRTVFFIAAAVVAAHVLVFILIGGASPLPKVPYIAPPNFCLGWAKFTDPATKQKMVYQEFTVTSHLDKPASDSSRQAP